MVFDWLFGLRKKNSFGEHGQGDGHGYTGYSHNDNHHGSIYGGYRHNDYAEQDFDDDLDAGMFDDDF